MHQSATSEKASYDAAYITASNHLTDTVSIAALEGRHAIAQGYEDSENESEAFNTLLNRVRGYYGLQKMQTWSTLVKALVQFSHINNTAAEDPDIADNWVSVGIEELDGDVQSNWISPERETASISIEGDVEHFLEEDDERGDELLDKLDGDEFELQVPIIEVEHDGGTFARPFDQEFIDAYDADAEVFEFDDSDVTIRGNIGIPNVGDSGEGGLPTRTVLRLSDFMELWNEVESQSNYVVGNFDIDLVSDMYEAMDDGRLDPSDVRGAAGMSRFLSGTDDAASDSYRMALLHQLDLEQPDLSEVASFEVEYTGYTDTVRDDDGYAHPDYDSWAEAETYAGLPFVRETPEGGMNAGETYATGLPLLVSDRDDGLAIVDYESG
ncbi:hypothetical protein C482_14659, partial [Natrialba chahannaoensis JCM 10990]